MNEQIDPLEPNNAEQRRRFLRLFGTAAVLLPITAITGCGSEAPPSAPAAPAAPQSAAPPPKPQPSAPAKSEPAPQAAAKPAAEAPTRELAELSLDDPTAQALGYTHDATSIDTQKFPQHQANQFCRNCTLFQGSDGDAWGPCSLFPGKKVNAGGWCSAYTPRPV